MNLETYWTTIQRIAGETTFRLNGYFGYEIVSKDDVAGAVVVKLMKGEIDLDAMESPNGFIATTARFAALASIDRATRPTRDEEGERTSRIHSVDTQDEVVWQFSNGYAEPERVLVFEEGLARCESIIEGIISKVPEGARRDAVEAYYLDGEEMSTNSRKKARSLGQKNLLPEEVASLQVWRAWLFPNHRNRTPKTEATPLLAALL